jgi:hypothetical protein
MAKAFPATAKCHTAKRHMAKHYSKHHASKKACLEWIKESSLTSPTKVTISLKKCTTKAKNGFKKETLNADLLDHFICTNVAALN